MAKISLKNINKIYPNGAHAVHDFNLEIDDKEFIVFVGPSGCGKSTTLRMIAGLEEISSGEFLIDGELMNKVSSKDRNIAMVFQSYALYPHMTVEENMGFALKLSKTAPDVIKEKVDWAAETLGLDGTLDRTPKELSGGQRQRVALGRAIVREPKLFLMDEPLSNLDAKLRGRTRSQIIKLHKSLDTNTIYVTHDQIEAMTMADRIVIMKAGYVQQVGTPKEVHDFPANMFVAGFIGTPPMNFLKGTVNSSGMFECGDSFKIKIPTSKFDMLKSQNFIDQEIVFGIRPEDVYNNKAVVETYKDAKFEFKIDLTEYLGDKIQLFGDIDNQELIVTIDSEILMKSGDTVELAMDMNKCHFFDPKTENVIK